MASLFILHWFDFDANLRCNIIEGNTLVILVDEGGWDGPIQDLVKDCCLLRHCPAETESL